MTESQIRGQMRKMMKATLAEEAALHNYVYEAIRPIWVPKTYLRGGRKVFDCSKGAQYVARISDAPDPMGRNWDGYGNSTTMTIHLHRLDHIGEVKVGDYVTFGYYGQDHATVVMGLIKDSAGRVVDLLLWSDGHPGAPDDYRLSYDRRYRHFLRNPIPHTLTAVEKLRAKTGFWAWVQWRRGTGAWRGHGKANPKVRPNVPKRIPLVWWQRYALLFAKHNRGANAPTT